MQLAMQTDFALRTLIYLAFHDKRTTVAEVAEFYGISKPHVAKVVNQLARHGFVRSIRGVGGGFELSRKAEEVTVGDVVLAFEGNLHLLDCVSTEDVCVIQPFCRLRNVLTEAERRQIDYLQSISLDELIPTKRQLTQIDGVT